MVPRLYTPRATSFCHASVLILTFSKYIIEHVAVALEKVPKTYSLGQIDRRLGSENGAERSPQPGIQAQHPAPAPHAPHARHDRSMARNRLAARPNRGGLHSPSPAPGPVSSVPSTWRVHGHKNVHFSKKNNGFLVDMDSLCLRHPCALRVL